MWHLCCVVLCCVVLCCIVLYCVVLCCIVLCSKCMVRLVVLLVRKKKIVYKVQQQPL